MRLFVLGLCLVLSIPSESTEKQETPTDNLKVTPLAQAILDEDTSNLRREIKKLLDSPTVDFFKAISSVGESGEGIFEFMNSSWIVKIFQNENIEELQELTRDGGLSLFIRKAEDRKDPFSVINELTDIISPHLGTENRQGLNALETAQLSNNRAIYNVLLKHNNESKSQISEFPESERFYLHLWGEIPKIKLEDAPLAQAILNENPEAFRKALRELYSGPAKNLFAVLQATTAEGDTLFHLAARVQSHQEEFARRIEKLIEKLVKPLQVQSSFKEAIRKGIPDRNNSTQTVSSRQPHTVASEASETEGGTTIDLKTTQLGRTVLERNIYAFHIELEKLLNDPSGEFLKVINSETETGEDIFDLLNNLAEEERKKEIERGRNMTQLRKELREKAPEGSVFALLELWSLLTPTLFTENKLGQKASETAASLKNKEVYEVLNQYGGRALKFDLHVLEKSPIWRLISQIQLEDTPLAQAILNEDPKAFRQALRELYSGPAKNLLFVFHAKTTKGDTLFHLAAQVKSHQEEFAKGIEELIEFTIPAFIKEHLKDRRNTDVDNYADNKSSQLKVKRWYRWLMGGLVLLGAPSAVWLFNSDYYVLGTGMTLVTGVGLQQCYSSFKENLSTKQQGKTLQKK